MTPVRKYDIVVAGGGPAGCAAALTAARLNAAVALIDEADEPGGHLRWTSTVSPALPAPYTGMRGFDVAHRVGLDLQEAGVDIRSGTVVWGLFEANVLGISSDNSSESIQAEQVILATGSTDIAFPIPGWELPGVMLTTAVFRMLHLYRVRPGHRAVVIGSGPVADAVSEDLRICGVDVVARSESIANLLIEGQRRVEAVVIESTRHAADLVVLAFGRQPDSELAQHVMCSLTYSDADGVFVPARNAQLETSQTGIYAVGDCAGVGSAAVAWQEGVVAALAAFDDAGVDAATRVLVTLRAREARLCVGRSSAPVDTRTIDDSTNVCRCEEVDAGSIRDALKVGATSINEVKRRTRAGMGLCQGTYCSRSIARMLHSEGGQPLEELEPMTARPPARVIPLAAFLEERSS